MPSRPQIERLRILHDLRVHFEVLPALRATLEAQLSADDQPLIERFVGGFEAEDWFGWTFAAVPWIRLIHGLGQQQFPA